MKAGLYSMNTPSVKLVITEYRIRGHVGSSKVTDYEIFLNDVRLRGFSTHGNMNEGYWGSEARKKGVDYAQAVAATLGVQVVRVRASKYF